MCTDFSPGMGSKTKAASQGKTPTQYQQRLSPHKLDKNKKYATLVTQELGNLP